VTEAEWLSCTDPGPMLEFLRGKARERKLRLFACACCRRVWPRLGDGRSTRAVRVAERYADGLVGPDELFTAHWHAGIASGVGSGSRLRATASLTASAWEGHLLDAAQVVRAKSRAEEAGPAVQARLIRDLFGNPFRPFSLDPSCQTPTVTSLAHAAYEDRILPSGELEPARLSVLADALEDAGCTEAAILDHLRGPGSHVRGCWCVDAILGGIPMREQMEEDGRSFPLDSFLPSVSRPTNSIGMVLVPIPAGTFLMGSPDSEVGRRPHEGPLHDVEITSPFYLGVHRRDPYSAALSFIGPRSPPLPGVLPFPPREDEVAVVLTKPYRLDTLAGRPHPRHWDVHGCAKARRAIGQASDQRTLPARYPLQTMQKTASRANPCRKAVDVSAYIFKGS
jgi:hypothetical protein